MKVSEIIELLQDQKERYGDNEVKVRDHYSGICYNIEYVTYWSKEKEYHIGIRQDAIREDE
ncbi:hypothetical protein M2451_002910 [Dysgonomonas sp. PFB1-18]|uniref:hypothetical protein n=1 Tax=unclassified Dysgonomonas TaxID=2630389 RepID=UPI0013D77ACC|nr:MULTISPECIES: hypothetical protein [unclassified Dysgonomonas]MDH6310020.1 hypothetical protein [Dysgonomonas sp. PF1-14]MDH6339929.1 hypothetical protein [Dysgonomonas sp. PF1-16]MDH6381577.1 hypothetical protein [Dysgonomonas sp. PFB1-18]MDH6398786.1 hypothetical protein [Dysgonomonas sp. PF1-23]NDV93630.1 hypothetical protein [Dysgonomonas sp. 521]